MKPGTFLQKRHIDDNERIPWLFGKAIGGHERRIALLGVYWLGCN